MVEGQGFQELMEYYEPGYTVPSRKHISKLMFDWYTSGKALLADKLQSDAFSLSLTTDIRMDEQFHRSLYFNYLSFLTSQWEFVDCVLATRSFPDHHMGENIASTIKEVLEAYKIADSTVSSIVHDQGSNMRQATDLLQIEKGWTGVNCSHILQLCIGDGFKTMHLLIELLVLLAN